MGGNIWFESKQHSGSQFFFTVKMQRQVAAQQATQPSFGINHTALIVDSSAIMLSILRNHMLSWGFSVTTSEVLNLKIAGNFDVAIVDTKQPLDGLIQVHNRVGPW